MYEFKKTIKDKEWTFLLLSDKKYDKDHGEDSDGITYPSERCVYFAKSTINLSVILHELMHVFNNASLINSSDLTRLQQEELGCEIVAEHYFDIGKLAFEINEFFHTRPKKKDLTTLV